MGGCNLLLSRGLSGEEREREKEKRERWGGGEAGIGNLWREEKEDGGEEKTEARRNGGVEEDRERE